MYIYIYKYTCVWLPVDHSLADLTEATEVTEDILPRGASDIYVYKCIYIYIYTYMCVVGARPPPLVDLTEVTEVTEDILPRDFSRTSQSVSSLGDRNNNFTSSGNSIRWHKRRLKLLTTDLNTLNSLCRFFLLPCL